MRHPLAPFRGRWVSCKGARVAKLVDAPGLGPDASNGVGVRVPPRAPQKFFSDAHAENLIRMALTLLQGDSYGSDC